MKVIARAITPITILTGLARRRRWFALSGVDTSQTFLVFTFISVSKDQVIPFTSHFMRRQPKKIGTLQTTWTPA